LPNLASAHEQGLADFEAPTWFAVFLPRGASEPIIRKLKRRHQATIAHHHL
jgi:tripartite-type tricarboxylate transporter receptor subunit TctC